VRGKRYKKSAELVDRNREYNLDEAVALVRKTATAKFNETIKLTIVLGVDVKQTDQIVRGTVMLPHNTGKVLKIAVFVKGEKEKDAQAAGADFVGSSDLVDKVKKGWLDFDIAIATPDMMKEIGSLAKILGPAGLMPNPKSGTVTFDVGKVVAEFKKGKTEYRADQSGVVHAVIGQAKLTEAQLKENAEALVDAVVQAKPVSVKGQYLNRIVISSAMGPGIKVDRQKYIKI